MTGRTISGSTIGIAYLSAICSFTQGYGLSQSRFSGNITSRVALTAHELGHNWASQHCDGNSPCRIMCSGLGGCNGLSPLAFGPFAINAILNHKATRTCLTNAVPSIPLPLVEPWDDLFINPTRWSPESTGISVVPIPGAPSAPFAINLDLAADRLVSQPLLAQGVNPVSVLFSLATTGVPAGRELIVEYTNSAGFWLPGGTVTADGLNSGFNRYLINLGVAASNAQLQVRFRTTGATADEDWYIDDIFVGSFAGLTIPFEETFPTSDFSTAHWSTVSAGLATVSTAGTNPPSPLLRPDRSVRGITTQKIPPPTSPATPLYFLAPAAGHRSRRPAQRQLLDA